MNFLQFFTCQILWELNGFILASLPALFIPLFLLFLLHLSFLVFFVSLLNLILLLYIILIGIDKQLNFSLLIVLKIIPKLLEIYLKSKRPKSNQLLSSFGSSFFLVIAYFR